MKVRRGGSRIRSIVRGTLVVLGCSSLGCAEFRDTISSRRFREAPFKTMFHSDDPMYVIRNVPEGDDRVRAMKRLKEPRKNGLSETDQEEILQILQQTATTDTSGLCRITAIETLARFEDPRVSDILIQAYRNSTGETPVAATTNPDDPILPVGLRSRLFARNSNQFTPETITTLQCRSLEGLGKIKSPAGLNLLLEVASTPIRRKEITENDLALPVDEVVNQFDVRLAAIRALANYPGESRSIQILVRILQSEKDVALRSRAHESLVAISGQDFSPEPETWLEWMKSQGIVPLAEETPDPKTTSK